MDRLQLAVREDVALDKLALLEQGSRPPTRLLGPAGSLGDAVVQKHATRTQQRPGPLEVGRQLGRSYVLEHPDAYQLVKGFFIQIAVVGQLHPTAIRKPQLFDARPSPFHLRRTQGHAHGLHAVALGHIGEQAAPTAADVEQTITRLQTQLAADMLELGLLRGLQSL